MPHEVDVEIGKKLRLLRLSKGLTQEDLGNVLGVAFQQIQKYESGANAIRARTLHQLAQYFNVSLLFFFSEEAEASSLEIGDMKRNAVALVKYYNRIDNADLRAKLFDLVKGYVKE